MKLCKAVVDLTFGDGGKGMAVGNTVAKIPLRERLNNTCNVRFSGGAQAGHRVVSISEKQHVFSHFGSATLYQVPTYWSEHCPIELFSLNKENKTLMKNLNIAPVLYYNPKCPVTTPYDMYFNQTNEQNIKNGTCGFGVGATFQREQDYYSLLAEDLWFPSIVSMKLKQIRYYYEEKMKRTIDLELDFEKNVDEFLINDNFNELTNIKRFDNLIFEGSQGLLLDQHFGIFPHVTRSNTGSKNIIKMGYYPEVLLVTRAYQTRHGNGPMTNESIPIHIALHPGEKNVSNKWQGNFRTSMLDIDLLDYAIIKDEYINREDTNKTLIITCLDHLKPPYKFTSEGRIYSFDTIKKFVIKIAQLLGINKVGISVDEYSENLLFFDAI